MNPVSKEVQLPFAARRRGRYCVHKAVAFIIFLALGVRSILHFIKLHEPGAKKYVVGTGDARQDHHTMPSSALAAHAAPNAPPITSTSAMNALQSLREQMVAHRKEVAARFRTIDGILQTLVRDRGVTAPPRVDAPDAAVAAQPPLPTTPLPTPLATPRQTSSPTRLRATILLSPVSNEVDHIYSRLVDLDKHVDYFVLAESCRDLTGENKAYGVLTAIATDDRFKSLRHKVIPVHSCTDSVETGFTALGTVRAALETGLSQLRPSVDHKASIVVTSDADEVPSALALKWIRDHIQEGVTYEFASTMPVFVYNFAWYSPGPYAMATARTFARELEFWECKRLKRPFAQTVKPIGVRPSGYHCSSCMSPEMLLRKWQRVGAFDGESMAEKYTTVAEVENLMRHGIVANSNKDSPARYSRPPEWARSVIPTNPWVHPIT